MPSLTRRYLASTTPSQIFGYARERTAWNIFNVETTRILYWSNTRPSGNAPTQSGFRIPSSSQLGLKIPEDDPKMEVWLWCDTGTCVCHIYEGFGGME